MKMEKAFNNASDKATQAALQSIWEKVKNSKTEMDSEATNIKLYVVNFLERLRYQLQKRELLQKRFLEPQEPCC